jgi:hypothetical protein
MKLELDVFETAEILEVLREEYKLKKQYFMEHSDDIEGLTTPEEIRKLHNYIIEKAHEEGELTFLSSIVIQKYN